MSGFSLGTYTASGQTSQITVRLTVDIGVILQEAQVAKRQRVEEQVCSIIYDVHMLKCQQQSFYTANWTHYLV